MLHGLNQNAVIGNMSNSVLLQVVMILLLLDMDGGTVVQWVVIPVSQIVIILEVMYIAEYIKLNPLLSLLHGLLLVHQFQQLGVKIIVLFPEQKLWLLHANVVQVYTKLVNVKINVDKIFMQLNASEIINVYIK